MPTLALVVFRASELPSADTPLTSVDCPTKLGELLDRNGAETPSVLRLIRAVPTCGELLGRAVSALLVGFPLEDVGTRGVGRAPSSETTPRVFMRSELMVARVSAAKGSLNRLELLISDCATEVPKSSKGEEVLAMMSVSKGLRLLEELWDSLASWTGLSSANRCWFPGWV